MCTQLKAINCLPEAEARANFKEKNNYLFIYILSRFLVNYFHAFPLNDFTFEIFEKFFKGVLNFTCLLAFFVLSYILYY